MSFPNTKTPTNKKQVKNDKEGYNERYILEIIPKIIQWDAIPYASDLTCQECGKLHNYINRNCLPAKIVGWCECDYGFQLVFECPYCYSKFRFHPQDNKFDIDDFVDRIMYDYVGNRYFLNGLELERKWEEYEMSKT